MLIEGRYYFSYGDIMRNSAVYAGNPVRSPLDNIAVSLGFYYRLGDRPHTPLPPPWYARIIAKREARQAQQQAEEAGSVPAGEAGPEVRATEEAQ